MNDAVIQGAGGVHPAPSRVGSWLAPLLPNEPRIRFPDAQAALTARYLQPVLPELEACLLAVRRQLDPELEHLQPLKLGKPYPLGQCLEIAEAVQKRLRTVVKEKLPPDAAIGLCALRAFRRAGGDFRQVWGDLRGQYFQNAFQVGTLYVDVANDTVTPTKPKVEVLPFHEAQFVPIRDFEHFRQIARRYWGDEVYPNHVLPELAPHCPLIHVSQSGCITLHDATQYMLAMTRTQGFAPSEAVLRESPMPQALFERTCHPRHTGTRPPESLAAMSRAACQALASGHPSSQACHPRHPAGELASHALAPSQYASGKSHTNHQYQQY